MQLREHQGVNLPGESHQRSEPMAPTLGLCSALKLLLCLSFSIHCLSYARVGGRFPSCFPLGRNGKS